MPPEVGSWLRVGPQRLCLYNDIGELTAKSKVDFCVGGTVRPAAGGPGLCGGE